MINEIGREVMQGGSRRSAIYASLNWKHEDTYEFIHAKDWNKLKIAGTDRTYADVRKEDFNFPCPLDMTNISVNFDTSWLMRYWKDGTLGSTFKEVCKQAMMTGEPGFSFNFFDKENETLRVSVIPLSQRCWKPMYCKITKAIPNVIVMKSQLLYCLICRFMKAFRLRNMVRLLNKITPVE